MADENAIGEQTNCRYSSSLSFTKGRHRLICSMEGSYPSMVFSSHTLAVGIKMMHECPSLVPQGTRGSILAKVSRSILKYASRELRFHVALMFL